MSPETDDDPVWHHPVEFIERAAEGRSIICLRPRCFSTTGDDLANGQSIELALMGRLAECGFRNWLFPDPLRQAGEIHAWLKQNGDSRSVKALVGALQQYLNMGRVNCAPPLPDYLLLGNWDQPLCVARQLRYWTELWKLKERVGAEVRLFMTDHHNERQAALAWMRSNDDHKFFIVGEGDFRRPSDFHAATDPLLIIDHRPARSEYWASPTEFDLYQGMHSVAYQVGRKKGWGDFRSAAFPINGNQRFVDAYKSGGVLETHCSFVAQFEITHCGGHVHSVIFTAEDEEGDAVGGLTPMDVEDRLLVR